MSIQEQISRISDAKNDIVDSIQNKGVSVPDGTKIDGLATYVDAIPTAADIPAAGTELGTVKSGGSVNISNGIITVKDDSHNHVIANVDGLQNALNGKQPSGSYVIRNGTGVQSITGGLVVGGTSATATGVGRIMLTGSTNPLIGLQAINASGTQLTPYYFQVSNDVMYLGPTSSKALAFDSNGNTSIPAALTVAGTIKENGTALSEKYATPTFVDGKFEALEDKIPTKTSDLQNDSGFKTTDNNTTYSLSKSGNTIILTGSDGSTSSVSDSNDTSYLPLSGGNMTGVINYAGATQQVLAFAPTDTTWRGGLKYSWSSNTTIGLWGKHKMSQFVWHAGTDFVSTDVNGTTTKTYDFQIGRDVATGTPIVRTSGNFSEGGVLLSDKYVTNAKLEEVLGSYVNDIDALLGG